MGRFWDIHAFAAGAALAACLTGGAAPAQVSAAEETALRAEQ